MSDRVQFDMPGSLQKPGPLGRLFRMVSGLLCFWLVFGVVESFDYMTNIGPPTHAGIWIGILVGLYVIRDVVNIGFTRKWGNWPLHIVLAMAVVASAVSLLSFGKVWAPPLGWFVSVWLLYTFSHLGISFLLSAAIATPGCEMRSIPHFWTLVTGRTTKEHYCPGFVDNIDRLETKLRKKQDVSR